MNTANFAIAILVGVAVPHLAMAVGNLIPRQSKHGRKLLSDGGQIVQLLLHPRRLNPLQVHNTEISCLISQGRFDEATNLALGCAAELPESYVSMISTALHCISRSHGDQAAVEQYLERASEIDRHMADPALADDRAIALLAANVAWSAIKAERHDLSDLVDTFSQRAFEAAPELPETQGTRGACLIERGHPDEGVALLTQAIRGATDFIDRADFCIFLAHGCRALGDLERAQGYDELREKLLGNPPSAGISV